LTFWILAEGDDDERFFSSVVGEMLREKYGPIKVWQYSQTPNGSRGGIIKYIKKVEESYIYVADRDSSPCVTSRKHSIKNRLPFVDEDRILVVGREIESWFCSGVTGETARKLGLNRIRTTDNISKEQLNTILEPRNLSRVEFFGRVAEEFDIATAVRKNQSFSYFVTKYL
jgi:hypothetical protein